MIIVAMQELIINIKSAIFNHTNVTTHTYIYVYPVGNSLRKREGRTESHEQPFFACKPGTADEGEYGGRWNQLLCYP